MSKSPSLLDVQRTLQRAIVDGDDAPLKDLIAQDPSAIAGAIDIYRNTIRWTLARSLRLCYPAVHRLVGAEFFEGAVEQFLQHYWPESACLNDFGEDFAAFLGSFVPASHLSYLADVARVEWAVHGALHAPEASALRLERLLQPDATQRAGLSFIAHPSLRLLAIGTPADEIWQAVLENDDRALAGIELREAPRWLLVQRTRDGRAEVSSMTESEWRLLAALTSGVGLEQALRAFCTAAPELDAERVLARHLAAGRFTDFCLKASCVDAGVARTLN